MRRFALFTLPAALVLGALSIAQADTAGAVADHPAADHRVVAGERRQWVEGLHDARPRIRAFAFLPAAIGHVHGDVGPFA